MVYDERDYPEPHEPDAALGFGVACLIGVFVLIVAYDIHLLMPWVKEMVKRL